MTHFLNNIWVALSTENPMLISHLAFPLSMIENYIILSLALNILNVNSSLKKRLIYLLSISVVTMISLGFVPSPYNVILNYLTFLIFISLIFKLNLLKSIIAMVFSSFIFAIVNTLLQNPYMHILNIDLNTLMNFPIYRMTYIFIVYSIIFLISNAIKYFAKLNLNFDIFQNLDKKTSIIMYSNLAVGILTIISQLIIMDYYIDILPIGLTILNFIILIFFFVLSIFSFVHIIKLAITTQNLQSAEEYNHSLEILYDKVRGFKHDFDNIISTFNGYLENNDLEGAKKYFAEVKKDCKITTDLSILDPRTINNPGIYSLLNNKYFKATNMNINMSIDFFLNLETVNINFYKFSRLLGILLDNAIEAASQCDNKIIRVSFRRENKNPRDVVLIENTYVDKSVDIDKIFDKGVSGKDDHSGIGLWEVRNYVKRTDNLNLFTSKNDEFFKQQLEIYDNLKKLC